MILTFKRLNEWFNCMAYKNKEDRNRYKRKWDQKNKERLKPSLKKYRDEHKEERKIIIKRWYEDNKEKINSNKRKFHAENPTILKDQYEKSKKSICIICSKSAKEKYCSKRCMGIGMQGETNLFWNGGSKEGYPKNWTRAFKISIRKRDGYICMRCLIPQFKLKQSLDVHHIDGIKKNTLKENCISLCYKCHSIIETRPFKKREENIKRFYELLSNLYGYKY